MDHSRVHAAIERGRTEDVASLIKMGYSADSPGLHGKTPLHVTASKNLFDVAKVLLENGASANTVCTSGSHNGCTPLHIAVFNNFTASAEVLLQNGSSANVVCTSGSYNGFTPLHIAVDLGFTELAECLVKYGASVNATTLIAASLRRRYGFTPLHLAAEAGREDIVGNFIKHGADVNLVTPEGKNALCVAAERGHIEVVRRLLEGGADVSVRVQGWSLVHFAVAMGNMELLSALLENNVGVNWTVNRVSPLHLAAHYGDSAMCEMLLAKGADVNALLRDDCSSLSVTLMKKPSPFSHPDIETVLKLCPVEIAKRTVTPGISRPIVEVLLKYGARADCKRVKSLLYYIIHTKKCDVDTLQRAIDNGADVTLTCAYDNTCKTPLLEAIEAHRFDFVKLLLENKADVHVKNAKGKGVFHNAVKQHFSLVIPLFVEWGADINSVSGKGGTALHSACKRREPELVEVLLDNGCDFHIASQDAVDYGLATPLGIAMDLGELPETDKIVDRLTQDILKFKAADLRVNESDWQLIQSEKSEEKRIIYENEVSEMKTEFIADSCVTYYSILTKSDVALEKLMRNQAIFKVLESVNENPKFPSYASMIKRRFRKASLRNSLIGSGTYSVAWITGLPDFIAERVVSYFSNADLMIFLKDFPADVKKWKIDRSSSVRQF